MIAYYCAANKPMQILNTLHYMIKYIIVSTDFFNDNKLHNLILISIIYFTEVVSKLGIETCLNLKYIPLNNDY